MSAKKVKAAETLLMLYGTVTQMLKELYPEGQGSSGKYLASGLGTVAVELCGQLAISHDRQVDLLCGGISFGQKILANADPVYVKQEVIELKSAELAYTGPEKQLPGKPDPKAN